MPLTCWNDTKKTILAHTVTRADNPIKRLIGLLNRSHLDAGEGLLIWPCSQVHSLGMRFVFDALFLDKQYGVVGIVENMAPWRLSPWIQSAHFVLELPAGTIELSDTSLGDACVLMET